MDEEFSQKLESLPEFDRLWDYSDPAATEAKFAELLPGARSSGDEGYLAELLTQVARAQGLQRDFEKAHATLDEAESMLEADLPVARVRYLLERGRVFNSSGQAEKARPFFIDAWEAARKAGADGYAVDAAHMVAIVETGAGAMQWNLRAMALAESSPDPAAGRWLGSLYNNIGWTYHDQGEFDQALETFQKGLQWRLESNQPRPTRVAKWTVGRALRSLGRVDEALVIQQGLLGEWKEAGETDGYVFEEMGECLLALGREDEARPHFARAFEELSKDAWLKENEAERLERLKTLGEV